MIALYLITQKFQQKHYIGYSADVHRRFRNHKSLLNRGKHHCIHLQRAWDLYGEDCFDFHVMFQYKTITKAIEEEQLFLEYSNRKNFYNCAWSNDPIDIIKYALSNEGKTKSIESRRNSKAFMDALAINRKKAYTKEAQDKRVATTKRNGNYCKGHRKAINAIHKESKKEILFESINEAGRQLKTSNGNICACLKGTRKKSCWLFFRVRKMILRDYQPSVLLKLRDGFADGHRAQMLYGPCGSGKTEIAIALLSATAEKGNRVAMILDRRILNNIYRIVRP